MLYKSLLDLGARGLALTSSNISQIQALDLQRLHNAFSFIYSFIYYGALDLQRFLKLGQRLYDGKCIEQQGFNSQGSLGAKPHIQKRLRSSAFKTSVFQRFLYILDRRLSPSALKQIQKHQPFSDFYFPLLIWQLMLSVLLICWYAQYCICLLKNLYRYTNTLLYHIYEVNRRLLLKSSLKYSPSSPFAQ